MIWFPIAVLAVAFGALVFVTAAGRKTSRMTAQTAAIIADVQATNARTQATLDRTWAGIASIQATIDHKRGQDRG